MRIEKYLEEVKRSKGFRRDKELADWLGVTGAAISQYKSGARTMDNEQCLAVALELGINPNNVIMATDMDRADRTGQKSLWEVFMQRMAAPVSAVLVGTALAGSITFSDDASASTRLEKDPFRQ